MNYKLIALLFCLLTASVSANAQNVAVIAHSVSTRMEARNVISERSMNRIELKDAEKVLVVCRSGLRYPMSSSYRSISDLDDDADMQLNISGRYFHVYLFSVDSSGRVQELEHERYLASDI